MKKIALMMVAGGMLIFGSCSKNGSVGPRGPQGQTGAPGQDGLDGLDGNANVVGHGKAFTVNTWTLTGTVYSATFSDPDITADVVNSGIVEMFKKYPSGSWTNLPDVDLITSTVFNFYVGGFTIYIQNSDGSTPANPRSVTFRDVIITASLRKSNPNTNWKNYNEATAALKETKTTASIN